MPFLRANASKKVFFAQEAPLNGLAARSLLVTNAGGKPLGLNPLIPIGFVFFF